jgi:predicted CoA-binding protein
MDLEKDILTRYRKIAVVGLSPDPSRPSHSVTKYLISNNYDVVGVRPGEREILNRPCYSNLSSIPGLIEIVDVFRASENVPAIVDEAIQCKAKVLWLQLGVSHPEAEEKARQAGILVVSDKCILVEHKRIRGN